MSECYLKCRLCGYVSDEDLIDDETKERDVVAHLISVHKEEIHSQFVEIRFKEE